MTLAQMAEIAGIDTDTEAIGYLLMAFQLIRTAMQGEPATFEGCCASARAWIDIYGTPTPCSVRQWLRDIGRLADYEFPDAFLVSCMAVDD